jgi:hypothetical protein
MLSPELLAVRIDLQVALLRELAARTAVDLGRARGNRVGSRKAQAWYGSARWERIRRHQLYAHPLCKFCLERGRVTPAEICDHVEPHRGNVTKFWLGPFQSLCKSCHDRTKQYLETRGYRPDVGLDGWPLDPRHPANTPRRR